MLLVLALALFFLAWVSLNVAASGKVLNEAMRSRYDRRPQ